MSTPPGQRRGFVRGSATTTGSLPDDLQERSVRRVVIFAWIVLVIDLAGVAIDHMAAASTEPDWPNRHHMFDLVGSAAIALVCGLMIAAGRTRWSVDRRIWCGIAFLLVLAFSVAVTDFGDGYWNYDGGDGHLLHGFAGHAFVMVITPVIIPMTARRAFAVATVISACGPAALLLDARILGLPTPSTQVLVQSSTFLMIPVAAVLGHIVHRLGLDVKQARALGSYTLEEKLGEGGMGEVWRARHRFLARPAAVKLIRSGVGAGSGRARFEREAQATAALKSPHTVEVYEFGISEDGEVYYVMELLDGFDLERLVGECGRQPAERVVGWLRQACHSLHEAHEAGIVHRDIKPANVFLCRYGQDVDFVKLLDFGLATLAPTVDAPATVLTGDNKILGTPAYMAPEQATQKSPVDARTDLYALGCVAYFALTGKRPFEADSAVEVILGHVDKAPVPPGEAAGIDLPEAIETLVLDCLAKDPADRPQSAKEVIDRLDGLPAWTDREAHAWWAVQAAKLARSGAAEAAA